MTRFKKMVFRNMKTSKSILLMVVLSYAMITSSLATDLLEVYGAALANDPQFKTARANWLADKENLAISRANLFPLIAVGANLTRSRIENENNAVHNPAYYNNGLGYGLKISQPIFDFGKLASLWGSQATVRKAHVTFLAEEEKLLYRVAERYFGVLLAKEFLSYAQAHKKSNEHLFVQSKHKYDVGLIPITDLAESRRNYERAVAIEVKSRNELDCALEALNEITGSRYHDLASLGSDFPLASPQPTDIEQWVKTAEQQNFELMAINYDVIHHREKIRVKQAGHFPTLTAHGGYDYGHNNNPSGTGHLAREESASVGLNLQIPIFSGGGVTAAARQANYQYQAALGELDRKHREVVSSTRQAYLGVISNISAIRADLEAIRAAESALKSILANYAVGRKTMSEVLDAQSKLYETQTEYAKDEHGYILSLLKLKIATGSLVVNDLRDINAWLKKSNSVTTIKLPSTTPKKEKKTDRAKTVATKSGSVKKIRVLNVGSIEPV